ncbi:hypothetical protein LINGRAHAP2_LOCUS2436 [Linum grandiflorum]
MLASCFSFAVSSSEIGLVPFPTCFGRVISLSIVWLVEVFLFILGFILFLVVLML